MVPFAGPGDRQTFVDRLYWNHDRLHMRPPSTGGLTAPDRPLFRDLFDRAGGMGSEWEITDGSWRIFSGGRTERAAASTRATMAGSFTVGG